MKLKFLCACVAWLAAFAGMAISAVAADDPIQALLFPPELLVQHREAIGLTEPQVEQIRRRVEQMGPNARARQERLNQAMGRLAELLSAEKVDKEAALKQLDEVLAIEKELKRQHFELLIEIRNELTAEQRQAAAKLHRTAQSAEGRQQRLQAKLAHIEKAVRARAEAGQPPFEVVGLMQKFPELMQNGQVQEAEALLDRAIALLGPNPADREAGRRNPGGASPDKAKQAPENQKSRSEKTDAANREPKIGDTGGAQSRAARLSQAELTARVEALKQEDVAWRKLPWKTCLLDGLKESRNQNKPIVLWVFIDRPTDDERC